MIIEVGQLLGNTIKRRQDDYTDDTIELTHKQVIAIWEIMGFIKNNLQE